MKRNVLKKNLIAIGCIAVISVALLLPLGLQRMAVPSKPVSEVGIGQAASSVSDYSLDGNTGESAEPVPFVTFGASNDQSGGEPPDEPEYVPGEILVGLDDGVTAEQLNAQLGGMDYVATRSVSEDDIMLGYVKLELAEGVSVEEAAARVKDEPLVKGAQPNYVYYAQDSSPDDAGYSAASLQAGEVDEGALTGQSTVINDRRHNSQWALGAVHAYEAWDTVRVEGRVTVAVVDSGVNANHEDLKGRVLGGYNVLDKSTTVTDNTGHGTHISGIIAATANNETGVAGVSYNANILPVKVMDSNSTNTANVLAGMKYVAGLSGSNAPKVMNVSIGSSVAWTEGADGALLEALRLVHSKGILVVYAAANKTSGTAYTAWESYPVDFDLNAAGDANHPGSIGVINAQQDGSGYKRNNSSNFNVDGKRTKTLCAPGSSILSTSYSGGYSNMSGTSMAAPYVAGVAALVFAANPGLTAADVKMILEDTASDPNPNDGVDGWDDETGYGMVNAAGAVKEAAKRAGGVGAGPAINGTRRISVGQTATAAVSDGGSRTWAWSSSAGGVAVVEGKGASATVIGVGAGQTIIKATSDDGIELSLEVTVEGAAAGQLANAQVSLSQDEYEYTGLECKPGVTVTVNEGGSTQTLRPGDDYEVAYSNNVDATTKALVVVRGKGAYAGAGSLAKLFAISPASLEGADVAVQGTPTYTGGAVSPPVTATLNGKPLTRDVDYTVDYRDNVEVTSGTARAVATVTGKGNYRGSAVGYFEIGKASITRVELSQSTYIYSGSACSPTVRVYGPKNGKADQLLVENVDYTVERPDGRTEVGRYEYAVQGKGNYVGDLTATLEVAKETLSRVQVAPATFTYDGGVKTPSVTVWGASGRQLVEGQDYTLSRPNGRINVGAYTYTATPKGGTGGTPRSGSFTIKQGSLGSVRLSQYSYAYDGGVKTPAVTVTSTTGKVLTEGVDYVLTKPSGRSAAGTYTYTARPINNYGGASQSASFTIGKQSLKNAQVVLSYASVGYDGSEKKPAATVTVAGKLLTQGRDYTLSYKNNVNVGTAMVSVVGMGNYGGTANATFRILLAPTCAGATRVPVGATASYDLTNGGSIAIKSGGSHATLSGNSLIGKAAGTVVLSIRDSAGVECSTKTVEVYSLEGSWELRSAMNQGMALDISGGGIANGASMIIWQRHGGPNQRFRFVPTGSGYYTLEMVHSGKRVDVDGASKDRGRGVLQWPAHGGANQQWALTVDANNYITFTSRNSGMAIDVDGSRMVNGRRVIQWPFSGTTNQKWVLVKCSASVALPDGERGYRLLASSAPDIAVDVAGSSGAAGANVSLWAVHGGANQRFQVTDCGSGFVRVSAYHSGKVLDASGGRAGNGVNVIQWPWTGSANQQWKLVSNPDGTYSFLSAAGQGYALTWSGSARSGANLQLATWTGAANQRFRLQGV